MTRNNPASSTATPSTYCMGSTTDRGIFESISAWLSLEKGAEPSEYRTIYKAICGLTSGCAPAFLSIR